MRRADFDALLTRLYPKAQRMLEAGMSRPQLCDVTIRYLWLSNSPESEDTAALRAEMRHLDEQGHFHLSD